MVQFSKKENVYHLISYCKTLNSFYFNENHIFGCRLYKNRYYKVDSISGVTPTNISIYNNIKNVGFIIPRQRHFLVDDLKFNITKIKEYNVISLQDIEKILIDFDSQDKLLDDLEVLIATTVEMLGIFNEKNQNN